MKNIIANIAKGTEYIKQKSKEVLSNNRGSITIEGLLVMVIMVGLVVLIFKPQITTLFTNVLGIWSTDVTTMFNNAQ